MRLPAALAALCLAPALAAGAAFGCGGSAFTTAPADAGVGTGPSPTDAGADGGGSSFCALEAGTHTFCDDFDGLPFATVWSKVDQSGGTLSTDTSLSLSKPASLDSVVTAGSATATNRARVERDFGTQVSRIVVSFALHLDQVAAKPTVGGGNFFFVQVGGAYSIGIDANTDNFGYFENQLVDAGAVPVPLTSKTMLPTSGVLGTWATVVFDVDFAKAKLSITINGTLEISGAPITPPAVGQDVAVYLGAQGRNFATAVGAHYDDVTVDVTP